MATKKTSTNNTSKLAELKEQIKEQSVCRYKSSELKDRSFWILDAEEGDGTYGKCILFTIQPEGMAKGILTMPWHEKRYTFVEAFTLSDDKTKTSRELGRFNMRQIAPKKTGMSPAWVFSSADEDDSF